MKVVNVDSIPAKKLEGLIADLPHAGSLLKLMEWAKNQPKGDLVPNVVADVIVQDEFTHDVIVPFRDVVLVFDTT